MSEIDIVGHIAYALMIIGHLFVTKKHAKGFIFRIVGGIIWMLLGALLGLTSIIFWSAVFAGVDCLGWYRFWKDQINGNQD